MTAAAGEGRFSADQFSAVPARDSCLQAANARLNLIDDLPARDLLRPQPMIGGGYDRA